MKKQTPEETIARLEEALKQKNSEIKKLRQTVKYHKQTKGTLKTENKQLKSDLEAEVKKTSLRRKLSDKQLKENLERRIRERFPDVNSQSVLSELLSNYMSESAADSEE